MAKQREDGGVGLSPPDVTYYNEIKYSVGRDCLVKLAPYSQVSPGLTVITLYVKGIRKARALATLLKPVVEVGNQRIEVQVKSAGIDIAPYERILSPAEIAQLYRAALGTNKLYKFTRAQEVLAGVFVYPVFSASVVQFYNDDLSDYYNNYNNVAAFVFRNVMRGEIDGTPIQFSTARKK